MGCPLCVDPPRILLYGRHHGLARILRLYVRGAGNHNAVPRGLALPSAVSEDISDQRSVFMISHLSKLIPGGPRSRLSHSCRTLYVPEKVGGGDSPVILILYPLSI